MEWVQGIRESIKYMEAHLLEPINADDVAHQVGISSIYLQKGFKIMTDYSMAEYMRNRRLYLAALDVLSNQQKVIDLAYKYGYDTPESFTKAFSRFHGVAPMQLRKEPSRMQTFLPLKIVVSIQGGNDMDFVVEKMNGFKVIGFEKDFGFDNSYKEIPEFWNEWSAKYCQPLMAKEKPENEVEETICNCCVGEFGVCIDDMGDQGKFRYMIAGKYTQGEVPEGMTVYEFPDMEWAKFKCTGPMPGALQSVNTKIFQEWLPNNQEYEIAMGANIEWYSNGDMSSTDYESGIWIPVKQK